MNVDIAVNRLTGLHTVLTDSRKPSFDGLRELYVLLREGEVCEPLDPSKAGVSGGMGSLFCADPDRHDHMQECARLLFGQTEVGRRFSPVKMFGGPLLLGNGLDASRVPFSADADADVMAQLLIGQMVGGLDNFSLIYHFPCGFACKAGKSRREVLRAGPKAKEYIGRCWRTVGIRPLKIFILLHFDFGDGEMLIARVSKEKLAKWLYENEGRHAEVLDMV